MNKDAHILLVEDDPDSRKYAVEALKTRGINNVLAPASAEECCRMIKEYTLLIALMDLRLDGWKIHDVEYGIALGEKLRLDGVEIAEYLREQYPGIPIGIYSSHKTSVTNRLASSHIEVDTLDMDSAPRDDRYRFLPDYVDTFFELRIDTVPLHYPAVELPIEAQLYYCRKLFTYLNVGSHLWKAGNYAWEVNVSISERPGLSQVRQSSTNKDNGAEHYGAHLHRTDYYLEGFDIHATGKSYHRSTPVVIKRQLDKRVNGTDYDLLAELVNVQFIIHQFVAGKMEATEAIHFLIQHSFEAQLESQKQLFRKLQTRYPGLKTKEDLYIMMKDFRLARLPKILDIYRGTVDSVDEKKAYITYESLGPENISRNDEFTLDQLDRNCLEDNSVFEYTIYQPYWGGRGIHIEPL